MQPSKTMKINQNNFLMYNACFLCSFCHKSQICNENFKIPIRSLKIGLWTFFGESKLITRRQFSKGIMLTHCIFFMKLEKTHSCYAIAVIPLWGGTLKFP